MDITSTMSSGMKIIIAKPSNGMSLGDLLFSVPTKEAEEAAFHTLHTECMGRATDLQSAPFDRTPALSRMVGPPGFEPGTRRASTYRSTN